MYCWAYFNRLVLCLVLLLRTTHSSIVCLTVFCLYCTTTVRQYTTPPPLVIPTGPRSVQTLCHALLHVPVTWCACCETLRKTHVASAILCAVQGRIWFKRLLLLLAYFSVDLSLAFLASRRCCESHPSPRRLEVIDVACSTSCKVH